MERTIEGIDQTALHTANNNKCTTTTSDHGLPLDQAKAFIDSIDLSLVVKRLIKVEKGWSRKEALAATKQYRNFLFLKKKYGHEHKLPPSVDIDEVWHAHVLHTQAYFQCCTQLYGHYLHHTPHIAQDASSLIEFNSLFDTTQTLYHKEFSEYIYAIRKPSIGARLYKMMRFVRRLLRPTPLIKNEVNA